MAEVEKTAYPADRWIRLTMVDGRLRPAYAPEAVREPLQAYDSFLYGSEDEIKKEIAQEMHVRWGEVANKERDFDEVEMDDAFGPCTVYEDGTITLEGKDITRAEIFEAYNVEDVAPSVAPSI
jgi:hypothetical protein